MRRFDSYVSKHILQTIQILSIIFGIVYLLGAFITLDLNVLHWDIFKDGPGRAIFGILSTFAILLVIYRRRIN